MWITLCWAPVEELTRAVVSLTVATGGVLVAFAHISKSMLDRLDAFPGVRRLGRHLSATDGRATVDASGLAEGLGMALATTLYVGVAPLHGLPVPVRTAGAVLAVSYVWDAVLQAVIDPGWYNDRQPPSRGMRIFRPTMPVILAGLVTLFVWPYSDAGHEVPSAVLVLLAGSPLLYYPAWAAFDVLLRASAGQAAGAVEESRRMTSTDIHSLIKNPLMLLHQHLHEQQVEPAEIRRLSWTAILHVETVRQDLLAAQDPQPGAPQTFGELWATFLPIIPSVERGKFEVQPASLAVVLSSTDYQLTQHVLPDLAMNALRSGASRITVTCRRTVRDMVREIELEVLDNGSGLGTGATTSTQPGRAGPGKPPTGPEGPADSGGLPGGPTGSLHALDARLRRFGGTIRLTDRPGMRGIRAFARWHDQTVVDEMTAAGADGED